MKVEKAGITEELNESLTSCEIQGEVSTPKTTNARSCRINKIEAKTREFENLRDKNVVYEIKPSPALKSNIEVIPFRTIVDGKEETLVEIRNPTGRPVYLPRKQTVAVVKGFEIWDPGKDTTASIKEVNKINLSHVAVGSKVKLRQVLQDYSDLFSTRDYDIGKTDVIHHHIDTGNHRPIRLRPYRTPHKLKTEMKTHIEEMLKN